MAGDNRGVGVGVDGGEPPVVYGPSWQSRQDGGPMRPSMPAPPMPVRQEQFAVLYTPHLTQKRKRWHDGRLVLRGTRLSLHEARPPAGSVPGGAELGGCDLTRGQAEALAGGGGSRMGALAVDAYLVQVDGPWLGGTGGGKEEEGLGLGGTGPSERPGPSEGMRRLLGTKFRKPARVSISRGQGQGQGQGRAQPVRTAYYGCPSYDGGPPEGHRHGMGVGGTRTGPLPQQQQWPQRRQQQQLQQRASSAPEPPPAARQGEERALQWHTGGEATAPAAKAPGAPRQPWYGRREEGKEEATKPHPHPHPHPHPNPHPHPDADAGRQEALGPLPALSREGVMRGVMGGGLVAPSGFDARNFYGEESAGGGGGSDDDGRLAPPPRTRSPPRRRAWVLRSTATALALAGMAEGLAAAPCPGLTSCAFSIWTARG